MPPDSPAAAAPASAAPATTVPPAAPVAPVPPAAAPLPVAQATPAPAAAPTPAPAPAPAPAAPAAPTAAAAPASVSTAPTTAGAPAKVKALDEKFQLVIAGVETVDPNLEEQAVTAAKAIGLKMVHYLLVAHPKLASYARLMGYNPSTGMATIVPVNDVSKQIEVLATELFDPKAAESAYQKLAAPAAVASASASTPTQPATTSAAKVAGAVAMAMLVFMLPFLFGGCAGSTGTTASASTASTLPAKLAAVGSTLAHLETPGVVQLEVQFGVAQVLQRAVPSAKQASVANWIANVNTALHNATGTETTDEISALIDKYTGPQTDPLFPLLKAAVLDGYTVAVKAALANPTVASVQQYVFAVGTGAAAGAAGYQGK